MKKTFSLLCFLAIAGAISAQSSIVYDKIRARQELTLNTRTMTSVTYTIDVGSSDAQIPSAKSVWLLVQSQLAPQVLTTDPGILHLSGGGGDVTVDTDPSNDLTQTTTFSGDVDGTYNTLEVNRIRQYPVSGATPTNGQALVWDEAEGWWKPTIINAGSTVAYTVPITSGNANTALAVTASATGVTASYASGELTVTVPTGAVLFSLNYRGVNADIQAGADAGGAVNWFRLKVAGLSGNTAVANMRVPIIQKTIYAATSPGLSAPYTINQGNNPNQSVVGVGSGSITIRLSGMAAATNGFMLTASSF